MALSRIKTWNAGDVLTASDLNAEFNNPLNNALSLISPLTGNLNCNSRQLTNLLFETQAASQTAANAGRVYYQTTENQIHVDDATNIRRVPTIASVARGDIIRASAASQWARLAVGAAGTILRSDGTDILYSTLTIPDTVVQGNILYASAANVLTALAPGTSGQVLQTQGAGANPQWAAAGVAAGDSPTWTGTHTWSSTPGAGVAPINVSRGGSGNNRPSAIFSMDHTATAIGNTPHLIIRNTDTTAGNFAEIPFRGTDSGAGVDDYVVLACKYDDHTAGSEDGSLHIATTVAGTLATRVIVSAGIQVGSPTGGDKGAGTINVATDIYKNNTAYNNPDYVLEQWAAGQIERYKDTPGAAEYHRMPLQDVEAYARLHYRLPGIPDTPLGLFERADVVLRHLEEIYTHLFDLDHRLEARMLYGTHAG